MGQGPFWTTETRAAFYTQDQGSRLMPAAWLAALRQPDGTPFLADRLARYGYLPNLEDPTTLLPAGFTSTRADGQQVVGMTCAACHTREIALGGQTLRIDGGPAFADFGALLAGLDTAVRPLTTTPAAFRSFAAAVLGPQATAADRTRLAADVRRWYRRFNTIVSRSLPPEPWGPGRLDAVAMIFNRLTGLDLASTRDGMIVENIRVADAPARYPFLWNAPRQDKTQWPGFADNGNDFLAMARNLGQVIGVFGEFHPVVDKRVPLLGVNYVGQNSANFEGLQKLEELIQRIGPPRWPLPVDRALAAQGAAIFARPEAAGGCGTCHAERIREAYGNQLWITPIQDVGTDSREVKLLSRTARSGVLTGQTVFNIGPLAAEEPAVRLLGAAVVGSIVQAPFAADLSGRGRLAPVERREPYAQARDDVAAKGETLRGALPERPPTEAAPETFAYESRVMRGIWAAAPYLHNGSVPTLEDLLKPAAERPAEFAVGPAYDAAAVGLARTQPGSGFLLRTTGCEARNSGNSRCGHEFGTTLSPAEKRALLEYLKTL
ncbi:hypothetical protein CKO45_30060 [Paracraurococcus ruber]|uniref:Cytochrome c domain-containing protein n=1 Tax=Paracraurococcus ruber TaxID=77675 RepID=A0ABS1D6B5_9PROT|nr:hypothetical protein [Paracraurococcus ruber]